MAIYPQRKSAVYSDAGVDYAALDAGKRAAVNAAIQTSHLLAGRGGSALDASRGEPAFVFEMAGQHWAFVLEGLGTKSVAARAVLNDTGVNRFDAVAYDTVAAIVNDLCCVGALPLVVNAYFATGSSDWYSDGDRFAALVTGWQRACVDAGCTWGGGESPSLPELVGEHEIELAGSAIGMVPVGREPILGQHLAAGNEIVLVASTGLHANGASLARMIADRLPKRYSTTLPSGVSFGAALLEPSALYAPMLAALLETEISITYLSHITGHGLLKLMRPSQKLTYCIDKLLPVPEVLEFLVDEASMSAHAAYSTFNMGCGFAVYVEVGAGERVVEIAAACGFEAIVAGRVQEGPRSVVLPNGVVYTDDEMRLSPERA